MSASTIASSSTSAYTTPAFWERLWRTGGIQSIFFFIIAYLVYDHQPQVGAPPDALVVFYDGDRTRILIAAVFSGLAILNLMWFAAALRATLAGATKRDWLPGLLVGLLILTEGSSRILADWSAWVWFA